MNNQLPHQIGRAFVLGLVLGAILYAGATLAQEISWSTSSFGRHDVTSPAH